VSIALIAMINSAQWDEMKAETAAVSFAHALTVTRQRMEEHDIA
jgi:hypothetical protein